VIPVCYADDEVTTVKDPRNRNRKWQAEPYGSVRKEGKWSDYPKSEDQHKKMGQEARNSFGKV
jgi:hypothetical protein